MKPKRFQEELSDVGVEIIKKNMIVYFSMQERTGKTLTSILVCEKINVRNVLIITKRKAYQGWIDTLSKFKHKKAYAVCTYGTISDGVYDLIILDEAHNYISSYPKRSATWLKVRTATKGKPLIYLSATPYAQGLSLIYHQLALSDWSPFRNYSTFYNWFRQYGIPFSLKLHNRTVNQYNRTKEDLIHACIDHLFISKTRKELGFPFEPKDQIHYIELSEYTKEIYNELIKNKVVYFGKVRLLADSIMRLRALTHMLEGGTFKTNSIQTRDLTTDATLVLQEKEKIGSAIIHHYYFTFDSKEKIDYILKTWGDTKDIAIMYNYKGEKFKLEQYFKKAAILQATAFAEGVELSHIKHLIIYSQDFSTARHTQRRARQASMDREHPIDVHFLLVKKAVSAQVYRTVARNKTNFVDKHFERTML